MNVLNNDTIKVVVSPVGQLSWLEEEMEVRQFDTSHISLMAYDIHGFKFTNCSSIVHSLSFDSNKFGYIETSSKNWEEIKLYANENYQLLNLKYQFEQNLDAVLYKDIKKQV